jgi:mono/diheme cytochrome c family protein
MPAGRQPRTAISDDEAAAIATFVRRSWGNRSGPVGAEDVQAVRHRLFPE